MRGSGQLMGEPVTIRVVVADDHALIRTGIATLLDSLDDLELVGDAADGEALLAVVEATRPDVVVMDVNMAGMDGITATRLVLERHPEVVVLVLSMVEDDASLAAAIEAKASGYILKASTTDQLPHAIRTVAAGGAVFDSRMVERLVHRRPAPVAERPFPMLTDRELEVLGHLARGEANQTIARSLTISPRTVANHVSNILMKLPALDRTDAVIQARAAGLDLVA